MNKNFLTGLVIVLILIGAAILYNVVGNNQAPDNATTTPPVVDNSNTSNNSTNNNTNNTSETTPPTPSAPVAVTSTLVTTSDNVAIVNGTVNPKGALTSYWYEYGQTSAMGSKTPNQSIGSGYVAIQATDYIPNLTKNTTYFFRLVAENRYGRSTGNQLAFKTTVGNPAPLGSAPTTKTLGASEISRTTANINGEVTPNSAATQYWFEYGKTTELGNVSAFSSIGAGSGKTPVSISLSNLEPLTRYYFRLNAQNQFGTINGSILNFRTAGPVANRAPVAVSQNATSISNSDATLRGTVNPGGLETKYWFEYSTDSLFGSILLNTTSQVTLAASQDTSAVRADISNLISKTNYYFRLVAQNSLGTVRGDRLTFKTK